MSKTCCICERVIEDGDDYDRIGEDYYCSICSNNELILCPICNTAIDPDVNTAFSAVDGTLFCSQECLDIVCGECTCCGGTFYYDDMEPLLVSGRLVCKGCL